MRTYMWLSGYRICRYIGIPTYIYLNPHSCSPSPRAIIVSFNGDLRSNSTRLIYSIYIRNTIYIELWIYNPYKRTQHCWTGQGVRNGWLKCLTFKHHWRHPSYIYAPHTHGRMVCFSSCILCECNFTEMSLNNNNAKKRILFPVFAYYCFDKLFLVLFL